MSDLQERLAILRQRIARVNEKYEPWENHTRPLPVYRTAPRMHVEEFLPGDEVETAYGCHFESEKLWENHRRHGSFDIGSLLDLPHDLLDVVSGGNVPQMRPEQWAFLDTETTGIAGGNGTCAFLVGVGRITREGFRVRQFFMRDFREERSLLDALTRHLAQFRVLITYNGRAFDQPLLENRYLMHRALAPFERLEHVDLLHGARRLWKLRFESCRLIDLENQVLGVEREGDVPGALIPYLYFEYVRTRLMARLLPVFHHNALDIVTLACLAGIVPHAFKNPSNTPLRSGAEMAAIARWLREAGELDQSLALFERAVDAGLRDDLLFRTLWDMSQLERKLGCDDAALTRWKDLAADKNPFRALALEELAKHYEHREKNYEIALEMTRAAIDVNDSEALRKREERLIQRSALLANKKAAERKRRNKRSRVKQ